jgi:hypothetical protein
MSDLLPARAGNLFPTKLARALERIDSETTLAKRYDQARIERVAHATESGLAAVAHISAVESMLIQNVPLAEGRLKAVADGGALAISRIVMNSGM